METRITYTTNEECWKLERDLKEKGYSKTSDCYWYQHFQKGDSLVILEKVKR